MATVSGHAGTGRVGTAMWRIPRTRGATSGVLLVLLGVWGGLIPFIGPRFGYAYTPNTTWTMTSGRLWLEVLPAAASVLGGLFMLASTHRAAAVWGSWLAAIGGGWFVVGPSLSRLWAGGQPQTGSPTATNTLGTTIQEIGFFYGVGAVMLFVAALGLGRLSVVGVRDAAAAASRDTALADDATASREPGLGGAAGGSAGADQPTTVYQAPTRAYESPGGAAEGPRHRAGDQATDPTRPTEAERTQPPPTPPMGPQGG